MDKKNTIKVYTTSNGAELNISAPSVKQVISATNNRAQYFAEQAKKYRDEARQHSDNAKYYSEQNSDVTYEYINNVRAVLENKISEKQDLGDYALREEIPNKVSELDNDKNYVEKGYFEMSIDEIKLPQQEGNAGLFLTTDGENPSWVGLNSFELFDTKISDRVLSYEELKGWALQGTFVYKDAIAGSRYGYPDFYAKCLDEYNEATGTETVNGVTVKVHSNGHKFYNIVDKTAIDNFYNSTGTAWFYGVDTEQERVFLPRDSYFAVKGVAPVVGNGMTLGITDGNNKFYTLAGWDNSVPYLSLSTNYGESLPFIRNGLVYGAFCYGVTTDPTKSGIEAHIEANEDKYLYICVGNTISDTSWVDVVTQVNGGVKDIEDKTLEGLERLKQSSIALTQTQITNCLLEVPQRIKLELNNGTLTLKAGSEVIVPNGFEADGTTPKFDYVTVETDVSGDTGEANYFYCYNPSRNLYGATTAVSSGESASNPVDGQYWYDTANNKVKRYLNSTWVEGFSLPFCVCATSGIKQIFNGMGYIGSTVWVDKGVKGLIPNGRNEDGTLNNIEFVTSKLLTKTDGGTLNFSIMFNKNALDNYVTTSYDEENNYNLNSSGNRISLCNAGTFSRTNGVISNFQPKQPFRAVDYNDISNLTMGMPDYTAGVSKANNVQYTAETNGHLVVLTQFGWAFNITINGTTLTYAPNGGNQGWKNTFDFLIKKGSIYKLSAGGFENATFFPMK